MSEIRPRIGGEQAYRRLLRRLLPARFHERFAADLIELYRDLYRHASARGPLAVAWLWVRLVLGAVVMSIAERRHPSLSGAWPPGRGANPGVVTFRADAFMQDIRYALRTLTHRPALSFLIVATLALGIGANTAIFSLVNTVLLRALPYPDADRLVMIWEQRLDRDNEDYPVRPANMFDWKTRVTTFEDVAWSRDAMFSVTGDGEPETVIGYRFSANMLPVLAVQPMLGRWFTADEDRPGSPRVAILSHKLWQRRYGGDPSVLGLTITLDGNPVTVVGIMPASFRHPPHVELWTTVNLTPEQAANRRNGFMRLVGRLKPGRTREEASEELSAAYRDLVRQHPAVNANLSVRVVPLGDPGDARPLLAVLFGGVGFVLLIACVNVSNLLLADSTSRRREVAVRAALGAGRGRIIRQVLLESILLAVAGGIVGGVVTWWTADLLVALFPKNISNLNLPLVESIDVNGRVFAFTLLVSLATGLLFGLLPAWNTARGDLQDGLREGDRGGARTRRAHAALVVAEVALSIVLLAGALLMVQSFVRLQKGPLGLDTDGVLSARFTLPRYRYGDEGRARAFTRALMDRVAAIPGVETAGVTNFLPLSGWWGTQTFSVEGRPEPAPGSEPTADFRLATEDYFRSMGIRLVAGRAFTPRDDERAAPVVIVNETLAARYWPDESPIGRRMFVTQQGERVAWEVVGVVGDVKSFGLDEPTHAELFRPYWQASSPFFAVTLKARVDPQSLAGPLRRAVWSIDKDQPITFLMPMEDLARESLAFRRVGMLLAAAFGVLALTLAAVGIYGVLNYSVSKRTREIGIRVALGATRREIASLVLREGLSMACVGIAIGLVAAFVLMRFLAGVLFEVRPSDPATYAVVATILATVALLATWLPARHATGVDPIVALRTE